MNLWKSVSTLSMFVVAAAALATVVPVGTDVGLVFRQDLSSRTAKAGDRVKFEVARDVRVNGKTVLTAGTRVTGVIEKVSKSGRFGKNGSIRLVLNPVNGIPLQPRQKGKDFKGSRTDKAAIASGAGLLVLGPIGLVGGVFIQGKSVIIHAGDKLETEVSRTVDVH